MHVRRMRNEGQAKGQTVAEKREPEALLQSDLHPKMADL